MFGFNREKPDEAGKSADTALINAMCEADAAAVARLIPAQDFVMIADPEAPSGGHSPLMLEVDGYPAVAAFTSDQQATAFAEQDPDAVGDLPAFVVGGSDFLRHLPEGVGAIINAADEQHCAVLAPDLVTQVKRLLS